MKRSTICRQSLLFFAACFAALADASFGAETPPKAPLHHEASSWTKPHDPNSAEPFWGEHQGGIVTAPPHHLYFAAFDLVTTNRGDVVKLLQTWTAAAARMAAGETAQPLESGLKLAATPAATSASNGDDSYEPPDPSTIAADTGETIGMSPSRLTLTFGFGAGLFVKDGKDRFGLAALRPEAFVDLPKFAGDQMVEAHTGGDLAVQACAEDPQVAFHAVRQLARIAEGVAQIRWTQTGYRPSTGERHLLGFSNGHGNPSPDDPAAMAKSVWAGDEAPAWMRGGSYVVVRRIRFALEHWDHMPVAYQMRAVGEMKHPGATPASQSADSDADMDEIPSHLRIVTPERKQILRRSYSYNDGVNFTAERWPPWRQGLEYDAGMFFICYQRDPQTGFIKIMDKLARQDFMMNQFWTHEGGGLFACPPGAAPGGFIGQQLFESP
jgi:deferrochelatase/peroxidase EfeB